MGGSKSDIFGSKRDVARLSDLFNGLRYLYKVTSGQISGRRVLGAQLKKERFLICLLKNKRPLWILALSLIGDGVQNQLLGQRWIR